MYVPIFFSFQNWKLRIRPFTHKEWFPTSKISNGLIRTTSKISNGLIRTKIALVQPNSSVTGSMEVDDEFTKT